MRDDGQGQRELLLRPSKSETTVPDCELNQYKQCDCNSEIDIKRDGKAIVVYAKNVEYYASECNDSFAEDNGCFWVVDGLLFLRYF